MKRFFGERYDFLPKIGKAMRNLDHIPIRVDDILMHLIQWNHQNKTDHQRSMGAWQFAAFLTPPTKSWKQRGSSRSYKAVFKRESYTSQTNSYHSKLVGNAKYLSGLGFHNATQGALSTPLPF